MVFRECSCRPPNSRYSRKLVRFLACLLVIFIPWTLADRAKTFEVHFERSVIDCDENFVVNCTAVVSKPNRTTAFVFNLRAVVLDTWTNNVTVRVVGYEFKGNQYKESIINFEKKICDMLLEKWIFPTVQPYSDFPSQCPVKAGLHYVKDLIVDVKYFPAFFPQSKWRLSFNFYLTKTRRRIADIHVYINVIPIKYKKQKKLQ